MKKKLRNRAIILVVLLICFVNVSKAQLDTTKFFIWHSNEDKELYFGSKDLICATDDGKKGFTVTPRFSFKNGKVVYSGFLAEIVGIGTCVELGDLMFFFEDNTRVTVTGFNIDCGKFLFLDEKGKSWDRLGLGKRLKAVQFTNMKSDESFTKELDDDDDKEYFIEMKAAVDRGIIGELKRD